MRRRDLRDFIECDPCEQMLADGTTKLIIMTVISTPPQCFSSVVGPNGSGKSNIIDAMLFVFGRRAKQVCVKLSRATSVFSAATPGALY